MNANVGMQYPVYAKIASYTAGTGITYSAGAQAAEAVSANVTWNRNDGHFYGDDVELDSDNSVIGYTISFEPSGLKDAVRSDLLGETLANTEYTVNDSAAPDVGFGYVRVMRENGENGVSTKYQAWWYYKMKFAVTSEESRTKEGGGIEWRIPTLEGTGAGVLLDSSGKKSFAVHRTYDTMADAKAWINTKANISAVTT